jgi:hypothetical protein
MPQLVGRLVQLEWNLVVDWCSGRLFARTRGKLSTWGARRADSDRCEVTGRKNGFCAYSGWLLLTTAK